MSISITINGEGRSFEQSLSVAAVLAALDLEPRKIAVERNLEIVPKSQYADILVVDGDRLEIVKFVGGG